ncbi:MAG: hypothetical protein HQK52_23580 [Oligoflexia bacterium]|nr:hypothetical protein [Oligoflexia bacterium]
MNLLKKILIVSISSMLFYLAFSYIMQQYFISKNESLLQGGKVNIDNKLCYLIPSNCSKTHEKTYTGINCPKGTIKFFIGKSNEQGTYKEKIVNDYQIFFVKESRYLIKANTNNVISFELIAFELHEIMKNFKLCTQI